MSGWMKHKLESRFLGEISITSDTQPNGRKQRGTKEPLDESERRKWKGWLKLSIQKTKIMASSPSPSWRIDGENMETVLDFIFLGSKISKDGDRRHKIKRSLILRKLVMTNLDSVLKSRDITLPTKIHIVKATVCPAVMYGCESWTIKKTESQRIDVFELWCWGRLLWVPWTARRSSLPILKEISPEYSLEGLVLELKLQYLVRRTDSLEKILMLGKIEGKRRRGQQRERGKWLDNIADSVDISLNKFWEIVKDRKSWHAVVHGFANSWIWLSDWTTTTNIFLCMLAVCISSLKIYLFKCVQHSKISFSVALFELWFFKNSLYHSITWYTFCKYFPFCGLLIHSTDKSSSMPWSFQFWQISRYISTSVAHAFGVVSKNEQINPIS